MNKPSDEDKGAAQPPFIVACFEQKARALYLYSVE